jgi:hypothetical protein
MNAVVPFGASPVSSLPCASTRPKVRLLESQTTTDGDCKRRPALDLKPGRIVTFLLRDRRFLSFFDGKSQADGTKSHVRQCCPLVLLRVVTAGRLCLANRAEILACRAVIVAVAGAATDAKSIHITAWVRGLRSCVGAGAIGIMSHRLYRCAAGWRRRVRALHGGVRRLLGGRALWCSLHAITLGRRAYGVLL